MNDLLILLLGLFYVAGAFIAWWVVDESVASRPLIAALWFVLLPFDILTNELQRESDVFPNDDDDNEGV